jgi:integrase
MATKVALREKKISKGRKSLYLDFYPAIPHPETGEPTRREFLGMYIFDKPKNPIDKLHNTETLQIGESIRQKRENILNKPEIYDQFEKDRLRIEKLGELDFVDYFRSLADKRKASNHDNWMCALNYLVDYTGGMLSFAKVDAQFLEGFKEHLLSAKSKRSDKTTLSQNSAVSYFNKVKACLKQAFKDGIVQVDINSKIASIKQQETRREFLTIEELNALIKTPCGDALMKRTALFSALTGLRFSDIQKLTWKEVEFIEGEGYFLNFQQQKTKGIESLPISDQAFQLMEHSEDSIPDEKVFDGLKYSAYNNRFLFQWIGSAGITKHITFHCFRHTYATLQLFNGTDIYTVSKMLGHKDLKTTQIYTKIVDSAKREATNKINLDM